MRRAGSLIAVIVLAMALAAPVGAAAEPVDGGLDVQLWPGAEPGASLIVISGSIAPDASLPATIALPVPTEGAVVWAGEVLGGDPAQDPAREPTLIEANGGRAAEFGLQQSRMGQLEARGEPLGSAGGVVTATMRYVQSVAATTTLFSVRVPSGATDVEITPRPLGEPQKNSAGESLYALAPQQLDLGEQLVVSVSYRLTAQTGGNTSGSGPSVLPILIGLLIAAVVVLVVVIARQGSGVADSSADGPGLDAAEPDAAPEAAEEPFAQTSDTQLDPVDDDDAFIIREDT